jgi:hypothetical protein
MRRGAHSGYATMTAQVLGAYRDRIERAKTLLTGGK